MDEGQIIDLYRQHGWNDTNAIMGDIRAGNWQSKVQSWTGSSGGSSGGGSSISEFKFDQAGADAKAMAELKPYYDKLLQMYGGDVALAKQRLDQDYERGLRVKTSNTEWEQEGYTIDKQERERKFKIALGDLDQQINSRGLLDSGIRTTEIDRAKADEAYQMGQIGRQEQALTRGLEQYKEQAGVDYGREAENLGYKKPVDTMVAGQFSPSQVGIKSPGPSYSIANFAPQTSQKEVALEEEKRRAVQEKSSNAWNRAYSQWMADAQRLAAA
jgi:hypothetical protein